MALQLVSPRFHLRGLLSSGESALVLLGDDLDSGAPIVIKQPKSNCVQTAQEIAILATLSHPRVIRLSGVVQCSHGKAAVFPYAPNGDLHGQLSHGPLPEQTVRQIMFQLIEGVAYLHRNGVWHRDLKPENILVLNSDATSVVIADFGLSVRPTTPTLCEDFCGTWEYSAPELVLRESYSEKVDMWALGITMFVCLTGYYPFDYGTSEDDIIAAIACGDGESVETPDGVSECAMELIRELLANTPERRLSAEEALNHRWFDQIRKPDPWETEQESSALSGCI
jgi:serine/threonine protein kinase